MSQVIFQPVDQVPGIGPKRIAPLKELGIETIYDLLTHFPFRYEDIQVRDLESLMDQEKVTLAGQVVTQPLVSYFGHKKNRVQFRMAVGEQIVQVVFFNQPYLKDKAVVGDQVMIFGRWEGAKQSLTGIKFLSQSLEGANLEAVYRTNKQIKQGTLIKMVKSGLDKFGQDLPNPLPQKLLEKRQLISHPQAVAWMHFPEDEDQRDQARQELIYQELFLYQLKLALLRKGRREATSGASLLYSNQRLREFIQTLPFELTQGQKKVTNEICFDLRAPYEMNRLLQGDVGSGKTIVATLAMVACVLAGYQAALMVPTELLADQHFASIQGLLQGFGIEVAKLTGSTSEKERKALLPRLADGQIQVLIGTHALFQDDVVFHQLGLAIIDEQHRFGVKQRQRLAQKGQGVNLLQMTATPIPRTLAITAFGEMDTSVLSELPKGRQEILTYWVGQQQMDRIYDFIEKEVRAGRQAYIISPLIEESESLDVQNAEAVYREVSAHFEGRLKVGLLHGRMRTEEKEAVMGAYYDNQVQVLVSTTVIEVGVDVPNATLMVILDADRFGLAQLHQLRGRVGRGQHASYCILVANPKSDNGKERMKIMTQSRDGFYLSQKDLELRGAGDVFGVKQSGIPDFAVADVLRDAEVLELARLDALELVQEENFDQEPAYQDLLAFMYHIQKGSEDKSQW